MTMAAGIGARGGTVPTAGAALAGLSTLVAVLFVLELALGPVRLGLPDMLAAVSARLSRSAPPDVATDAILFGIRAPRACLGLAVGASLALSGAALQGLFRNPLADPGLIGVSAGATVGAVTVIVLGSLLLGGIDGIARSYALPLAAFAGAMAVTAIVFAIGAGSRSVATLLLAGIAINAIAGSMVGGLVYVSDDAQLRDLTFWGMGSLGAADWTITVLALLAAAGSGWGLLRLARPLDLLQLGDRAAFHAGVSVAGVKLRVAALSALGVGAATAAAGPIGFIGLVGPHIARMIVGAGHRRLLPAAALCGAALTLAADLLVRLAVPPAEPPIGLATSLIGGPFFLYLLLRMRRV